MKLLTFLSKRFYSGSKDNFNVASLPFPDILSEVWYLQAYFFLGIVGGWGKALLGLSSVKVHNGSKLMECIYNRSPDTPLITVCNHASMLDDPALMSKLVDWKTLLDTKRMRWSLAAQEICFSNKITSYICSHGKVIPCVRGAGVYQPGMDFAIKQLNHGRWVHIFPEGKVTLQPIRLKWGVGRLVAECVHQPIVLPFYHAGMNDVLPSFQKPYIPRIRKKVTVLFGEPIKLSDMLIKCKKDGYSEATTRKLLTDTIQDALYSLKEEAEKLHHAHLST